VQEFSTLACPAPATYGKIRQGLAVVVAARLATTTRNP